MKNLFKNDSIKSFLHYSIKHKSLLILVVLLSFLSSAASAIPAWLVKYLTDDVLVKQDMRMLAFITAAIVGTTVIKGFSMYYRQISSSYVTETIKKEIKQDVYIHLQSLPISYYQKVKLGDIMARVSGDAQMISKIGFVIFEMLTYVTTAVVLLFRLFQLDIVLSIFVLFGMPVLLNFVKKYTKKIRKSARNRQDTTGQVTAYIQESLSGIAVIKAFAREQKSVDGFKAINEEEFKAAYKTKKIRAKVSPINEVLGTLMMAAVLAYGGYKVVTLETFTPGDLISFLTALGLLQEPIKKLVKRNNELQGMIPSADRVVEILNIEPEVRDRENSLSFKGLNGNVEFKDISFTYPAASEPAIKNFSLEAKKGEVVAFVGKSGSGKTTLVNLIPRFYEIQEGSIRIDGTDTRDIKLKSLRKNIGIVPQETFLFSGTIASNIAYGRDEVTQEEIIKSARMSNAYDFIMEFEKGFDTEVGERGTLLSGGQKQRIAIARALIQNPEIMILDEATSALDTESERLVQDALEILMRGRTTFVIAHRLSTIINADKIVVMEKGEVKEVGTHNELLGKNGIYKKLYETQFGKIN